MLLYFLTFFTCGQINSDIFTVFIFQNQPTMVSTNRKIICQSCWFYVNFYETKAIGRKRAFQINRSAQHVHSTMAQNKLNCTPFPSTQIVRVGYKTSSTWDRERELLCTQLTWFVCSSALRRALTTTRYKTALNVFR